eukprot:1654429-Pyramimonas_sp.AAC.1
MTEADAGARDTCTDEKALAAAILPLVTSSTWLKYGSSPGTDKLTEECQDRILDMAPLVKAVRGVSDNLAVTERTAFEAMKI